MKVKLAEGIVTKYNLGLDALEKMSWQIEDSFGNRYYLLDSSEYQYMVADELSFFKKIVYGKTPITKHHIDSLRVNNYVKFKYVTVDDKNYIVKIISFSFTN